MKQLPVNDDNIPFINANLAIGPLTQVVKRSLLIHNPHPSPIAFKVKTTAPKQYCVRPNSGRVEGGESVEVQGEWGVLALRSSIGYSSAASCLHR